MLHVFISGFRSAYRVAVLNAVCAPIGSSQRFTYTEGKNVSAQTVAALQALNAGEEAFLTFVDRFANGGYRYIPVRRAQFVGALVDAGKVEVTVRFKEWPSSAPGGNFSQWLATTLAPMGAPRLVDTPDNEKDGDYLLVGPDPPANFFGTNDGWRSLVEVLSGTQALGTTSTQTVIFARLDILKEGSNIAVSSSSPLRSSLWNTSQGQSRQALRLERSHSYRVRVDYFFPLQKTDRNSELPYGLVFSPGLEATTSTLGRAGAQARADEFGFKVAPLSQRSHEYVQLQFGPAPAEIKGLVGPRLELPVEPRSSTRVYLLFLLIGAAWVIGTGFASQTTATNSQFQWGFYVGPLIQYVAFLLMFRVFGTRLT